MLTNPANTYVLCPAGKQRVVLVDAVDLGVKDTQFGPKHKIRLVFESEKQMEDGRPYLLSPIFNNSIGKNNSGVPSALRKLIEDWIERSLSKKEESNGFDIDSLVGKTAYVGVIHKEGKNGKTYDEIAFITSLPNGMKELTPSGHYKKKESASNTPESSKSVYHEVPPPTDDDLPF